MRIFDTGEIGVTDLLHLAAPQSMHPSGREPGVFPQCLFHARHVSFVTTNGSLYAKQLRIQ